MGALISMRSSTAASIVSYVGFLIIIVAIHNCFCNGNGSSNINNSTVVCRESEMQALLKFKQDVIDPSNRLSSWAGKDCCQWTGVVCDNFTSHVHEIHLRNPYELGEDYDPYEGKVEAYLRHQLGGKINPSLLDLKYLHHLDLSFNDFGNIKIPSFIGSIPTLRYLNLTHAGFSGSIPPELGNLTRVRYLGLGGSTVYELAELRGDNLEWLSRLVSLQHLHMQDVNLSKASNWLQVTNMLPSLVELHLSHCQLKLVSPPININFTSLAILDLSENPFDSSIPGWIFNLNRLVSLDISHSNFHGPLPSGFQNMTSLRVFDASSNYLNASLPMGLLSLSGLISLRISSNNFQTGPIPIGIGNMTNLRDLDLGFNSFNSTLPNSLFTLSRLEHLNLEFNRLQGVISSAVGSMSSLTSLILSFNQFEGRIPISLGELCELKIIDLSRNKLGGDISQVFKCFSRCKSIRLEKLDLRRSFLQGHLPNELGQFKNLAVLLLDNNNISGPIPTSLGKLSSLKRFSISQNRFNGTLPESLGQLAMLEEVYTHNNLLQGSIVADIHFANLMKLKIIIASGNNFSLEASDSWVPPFQLDTLELRSWRVGPQFPIWLQSQKMLYLLDLSNAGISDSIPTWFWSKASHLLYLNLSCNQISGETPKKFGIDGGGNEIIDLRSNSFKGLVPRISSNVKFLDLSNNFFWGSTSHFLCDSKSKTDKSLEILLLKNNRLSGRIPNCWKHWKSLEVIKLDNNNLHGFIPPSIRHLTSLKYLHLRHNNLSGELPQSLQHCTMLLTIDLAENGLSGSIPTWMGNSFSQLIVLNLRSNKFQGLIPYELCRMVPLQILDLSHNNISGSIPICFQNFEAMVKKRNSTNLQISTLSSESWDASYQDVESLVIKAKQLEYSTILTLVKSMDLSVNNLSGEIPEGLTKLVELQSLNLSRNHLTGRIPYNIGDMKQLESLDFSRNQLCGGIPSSLSNLTYLSHLNLSYNNLTGRIPLSTQIQGFDDSSFVGNNLCGPPLTNCNASRKIPKMEHRNSEGGEGFPKELFLASLALGFAVGFWTIQGLLLFNLTWRIAYFRLLDAIGCNVSNFIFKCRYIFNN